MFAIRCTESVLARVALLPHGPAITDAPPPPDTVLGDWYVLPLDAELLLCTSALSLLTLLLRSDELDALPARLRAGVQELLELIGVPRPAVERELRQMRWSQWAPAGDAPVHRTMAELRTHAQAILQASAPATLPVEIAMRLGNVHLPTLHLGHGRPIAAAQELFGLRPAPGDAIAPLEDDWIGGASPD